MPDAAPPSEQPSAPAFALSPAPVPAAPAPSPPLDPAAAPPSPAVGIAPSDPTTPDSAHSASTHPDCLNCDTKLAGPFCHRCGQHDFDAHRSFGHALHDALENFFHFEGKFFRNVVTLLFQPGRLSAEFNAGKRAAQMPPFRLYLFVSLAFFALTFSGTDTANFIKLDREPAKAPAKLTAPPRAAPGRGEAPARRPDTSVPAEPDHPSAHPAAAPPTGLERLIRQRLALASDPVAQREMIRTFVQALPKLMLLCLPLFALYTRLLWRKSADAYYLRHLVVALHFHTFVFLWLLFRDGWTLLFREAGLGFHGWIAAACNLWLVLYPALMLRHLFGRGQRLTLWKPLVLAFLYAVTLGIGFLATGAFVLLAT